MVSLPAPAPAPANATFPLPGSVIDNKYVVEEELGNGGMGVVVAARHQVLGQRFAIKFLVANVGDPGTVKRFVREARAVVELKSEHVVRVSDVGQLPSGQAYMVMEYLEGEDLGSVLKAHGPLRITEAVGFVLQACEAVAEAHSRGIIHRDLKPGNLFLTTRPDGTALIKVVDFGVSKVEPRGDEAALEQTDTRAVLGSPYYMSPEQVRGAGHVDARSDIWSMGVTLYELLTGQRAFQADTITALSVKIVGDPFILASKLRREIPTGLDNIIRKCLAKDPELRFQTIADLARALAPFAGSDARIAARRAVRIASQSSSDSQAAYDSASSRKPLPVGSSHPAVEVPSRMLAEPRVWPTGATRNAPVIWVSLGAVVLLMTGIFGVIRTVTTDRVIPAVASSIDPAPMAFSAPTPPAQASAASAASAVPVAVSSASASLPVAHPPTSSRHESVRVPAAAPSLTGPIRVDPLAGRR